MQTYCEWEKWSCKYEYENVRSYDNNVPSLNKLLDKFSSDVKYIIFG